MIREGASWIAGFLFKIFLAGMVFMFFILIVTGKSCGSSLGFSDTIYIAYSKERDEDSLKTFYEIEDAEFEEIRNDGILGRGYHKADDFSMWTSKKTMRFSFNEVRQLRFKNRWLYVWMKGGGTKNYYAANNVYHFRIRGEDSDGNDVTIYPDLNKYMDICFFEPRGNIR